MINRVALTSNNLMIENNRLLIKGLAYFNIPITSIHAIELYEPNEVDAGYIGIINKNLKDADIIFFHKDYFNHIKSIFDEIKSNISKI